MVEPVRAESERVPFIGGVILAAGRSERMGRPKQLLPLGGRPLLQHVIDAALDSWLDEIVLVLGHCAEEIRDTLQLSDSPRLCIVENPDFEAGQSSSLRCGLQTLSEEAEAAAILLGDQPGVTGELINEMMRAFFTQDAPALRPVYRGKAGLIPSHPVLLARSLWPEVDALSGDLGLRDLFASHPEWLAKREIEGEAPTDVDTPATYQQVVDGE